MPIVCSCSRLSQSEVDAALDSGRIPAPGTDEPPKRRFARVAKATNQLKREKVQMQSGRDAARVARFCGGCRLEHEVFERVTGQRPPL